MYEIDIETNNTMDFELAIYVKTNGNDPNEHEHYHRVFVSLFCCLHGWISRNGRK